MKRVLGEQDIAELRAAVHQLKELAQEIRDYIAQLRTKKNGVNQFPRHDLPPMRRENDDHD